MEHLHKMIPEVMALIEEIERNSRGTEGMMLNVCLSDGNLHKEIKT